MVRLATPLKKRTAEIYKQTYGAKLLRGKCEERCEIERGDDMRRAWTSCDEVTDKHELYFLLLKGISPLKGILSGFL